MVCHTKRYENTKGHSASHFLKEHMDFFFTSMKNCRFRRMASSILLIFFHQGVFNYARTKMLRMAVLSLCKHILVRYVKLNLETR